MSLSLESSSPAARSTVKQEADVLLDAVVREKDAAAHADILRQGQVPPAAHVLLSGHACQYRMLADGRRQITAILVPGDICDIGAVLKGRAAYSVGALTACRVGEIAVKDLSHVDDLDPTLRQVLWQQLLRNEAVAREWLLSLGRRSAMERLAHLFCELWTRLRRVGLADETECTLKFTQGDLADIMGLSTVHVNRTLQDLRGTRSVEFKGGALHIFDHAALAKLAGFDPSYLELA